MAAVALNNVTKVYPGKVLAVHDLSIDIHSGEFVVLVGPSGCGKSTTLRMIAGLEKIDSGTVSIGDRVVNKVHPKDRDIAMVFQNYAIYPHMTVYKNMAFALKLRKLPRAETDERVHSAAQLLGIENLLDRKPKSLSGGQRQRVALGHAIVLSPACFLFDEPLSNLDAKLRIQMRSELKALRLRLQATTLYVTHDQEEAMTLGDRIAVMCDGRLQQIAPPVEVYRRPVNRFVAGFVGFPPMNFIDGRIIRHGDGLRFNNGSDVQIDIRKPLLPAAQSHVNQSVVLGLRPEALHMTQTRDEERNRGISVKIHVIEPLGDRTDLYGETQSGVGLTARVDAQMTCDVGTTVEFSPNDVTSVHLFEPGPFGEHLMYGAAIDT